MISPTRLPPPLGTAAGSAWNGAGVLLARRPVLALVPFALVFLAVPLLAPANANLYDDEAGYLGLAHRLVGGHYLSGRDDLVGGGPDYPNLWFGPGLPLALAPLVALHLPVALIRLAGPAFLFAALVVFFRLLALYLPPRRALLGAALFGLYLPFYTVIAFLHSEALAVLCAVLALYGIARHLAGGSRRSLLLAAGGLAGLALTRVAFGWIVAVLLVLFAAVWLVRRRAWARRLVLVHALALALCLPWLAYTYSVTGHVFYWGASGSLSLYWITAPYPGDRGDWHGAADVFRDPRLAPHRPFFRSLRGLDLAEQNAKLRDAALTNIRERPMKFVENVLANASRIWVNAPYSFKPFRPTGLVYAIPNVLLLLALLRRLVRYVRGRGWPWPELAAFAGVAAVGVALHVVLSGYPRMLVPVIPALLWLVLVERPPAAEARHG